MTKSKPKPNGKKAPVEEKKQYLEPEFTKTRVVDFDLKELRPPSSTSSTCSTAPSPSSAPGTPARP
uniref:Uncharacterized protein n=1 Tax=Oryzias sinensis TaxID=183150 RepID=A0A8C7WT14_9TELE